MKRNFTLLEILIALALFVGLAVTCSSIILSMTSSMESQQARSKHVDSLVMLDRTLKKMLTHMVKFTWRDEDNQKVPHFMGLQDRIRFVHLNKVNDVNDGGLRFVELAVDEEGRLMANYQTRPFRNGIDINDNAYSSVLSENVSSIVFRYASVEEGETSSETLDWLDEWEEDREDIPLAVLVSVTWQNGDAESFLWRTAGNSYFERWGAWRNYEGATR